MLFIYLVDYMLLSLSITYSNECNIKMRSQEISSIGRTLLEFFCVPLYTDYFSNLSKAFQVAFTQATNVEYQIWSFCYNLLSSYIYQFIYLSIYLTHTYTGKNAIFAFRELKNMLIQIFISKI